MVTSDNMSWRDINDIRRFTENTDSNKEKRARRTVSIILAAIQLMENFIKGIKQLNAYDASSIILSEANWIQKNTFSTYKNSEGIDVTIEVGKVYYVDYGKAFKGELSYFHYGLCIGKKEGKILIVPMTSGTSYIDTCYHPIENPRASKKFRKGLIEEGFSKNCVLKINDLKYISAGRIEKEDAIINQDVLKDIQKQVFQVEFPELYNDFNRTLIKNKKYEKQICDQKEIITKLKNDSNHLNQILKNMKNGIDTNNIDNI